MTAMWLEFWLSVAITVALLYGPGYPFFRGVGFSRPMAACCAPLFSVCMYSALPIALWTKDHGGAYGRTA